MKLFEKLKQIGIHIPNLKVNISVLNFTFTTDKSIHVEGNTLHINPDKLNGKTYRKLAHLVKTEGLDEAGAIVDARNSELVSDVAKALPEIKDTASNFEALIPPGDLPLLKACLYLRRCFEAGASVDKLKSDILRVYGQRGGNLCNLCTTGYLESFFLPLFQSLLTENSGDPNLAKLRFQITYSSVLNELPFTEFVSQSIPRARVLKHIIEKMKANLANGVRYMEIHGLGPKNVQKVEEMLPEIMLETGAIIVRTDKSSTRIFVRLDVPRVSK